MELVTGKIKRIYSLEGQQLQSIEEFEAGKEYVVVANEDAFIKTRYNVMSSKQPAPTNPAHGLAGASLKNEMADKIRPISTNPHDKKFIRQNTDLSAYSDADGEIRHSHVHAVDLDPVREIKHENKPLLKKPTTAAGSKISLIQKKPKVYAKGKLSLPFFL